MEDLSRRKVVAFGVLLLLLIALAYGNTVHSPFTLDDRGVIHRATQGSESNFKTFPPKIRYLFLLSYAINYSRGKQDPFGYHLFNISLHFLTTLVIFFITYITIHRGTQWGRQAAGPIAAITSLFFALSPVHTETVTYISGRSSGLAGLFYFSSLLFFILANFRERGRRLRIFCILFSVVFFGAAILSKETAITLPAIILLYDFCFMNGDQWSTRKNRFRFIYLPCLIFVAIGVLYLKGQFISYSRLIDFSYALEQARIIGHGVNLLLFPVGMTLTSDFPDGFFPHPMLRPWPILLMIGLVIAIAKHFPKAKKFTLFCVCWFLISISPTNSIIARVDMFSQRNLYFPSFVVFLFFATTIYHLYQAGKPRSIIRKLSLICLGLIFILQATLLLKQNALYRSNIVLWSETVKNAPGNTIAWQNLSHQYLMTSNYKKALESLQGVMRSNPKPQQLSQAQSKLGIIYSRQGNFQKAIASYNEAIRLDPSFPTNHLNLGGVYLRQKQFSKAKEAYENAELLYKSQPVWNKAPQNLYLNKAYTLYNLRLFDQAEDAAQTYLDLVPGSKPGHSILGYIYLAMGKKEEAALELAIAKKISVSAKTPNSK
jgi:Flp pilus assembly protein TadD